jgi:hypothetical protein
LRQAGDSALYSKGKIETLPKVDSKETLAGLLLRDVLLVHRKHDARVFQNRILT